MIKPLHSLLILGRVSNLPTVWSNCLAGWFMGGAGFEPRLVLLLAGATFLYLMGMYLNDAVDAGFDRAHRSERPIPTGAVSRSTVFLIAGLWTLLGLACLAALGGPALWLGLFLTANILLYDILHKYISWSPILMAGCRFFLILLAAAAPGHGLPGYALWAAIALGCYIVGLSYVARRESLASLIRFWPCLFLLAPVVLAHFRNSPDTRLASLVFSAFLLVWIALSLRLTFWTDKPNLGATVSRLLAGIVLVDALAAFAFHPALVPCFVLLFAAALAFQRYIPAT